MKNQDQGANPPKANNQIRVSGQASTKYIRQKRTVLKLTGKIEAGTINIKATIEYISGAVKMLGLKPVPKEEKLTVVPVEEYSKEIRDALSWTTFEVKYYNTKFNSLAVRYKNTSSRNKTICHDIGSVVRVDERSIFLHGQRKELFIGFLSLIPTVHFKSTILKSISAELGCLLENTNEATLTRNFGKKEEDKKASYSELKHSSKSTDKVKSEAAIKESNKRCRNIAFYSNLLEPVNQMANTSEEMISSDRKIVYENLSVSMLERLYREVAKDYNNFIKRSNRLQNTPNGMSSEEKDQEVIGLFNEGFKLSEIIQRATWGRTKVKKLVEELKKVAKDKFDVTVYPVTSNYTKKTSFKSNAINSKSSERARIKSKVLELNIEGMEVNEIANSVGISLKRVERILTRESKCQPVGTESKEKLILGHLKYLKSTYPNFDRVASFYKSARLSETTANTAVINYYQKIEEELNKAA